MDYDMMKKIIAFLVIAIMLVPTVALAGTGTYNSTYSFTGGLYSKTIAMNKNRNVKVTTTPDKNNSPDANKMNIYLQRKGFWGWGTVSSSWNNAKKQDTCNLYTTDEGSYRIYFQAAPSGYRYSGSVKIVY